MFCLMLCFQFSSAVQGGRLNQRPVARDRTVATNVPSRHLFCTYVGERDYATPEASQVFRPSFYLQAPSDSTFLGHHRNTALCFNPNQLLRH